MTQVDFYLLAQNDLAEQMQFCARLCEKATAHQLRAHVLTSSAFETKALDEALWSYREDSFLPHAVEDQAQACVERVTLSHASIKSAHQDLLVLTQPRLSPGWEAYRRVALVIANDERLIQASRQLYRQLQTQRFTLNIHDLRRK